MRLIMVLSLILVGLASAVILQYAGENPYVLQYYFSAGNGSGQRFTPPFNPGVITFAWAKVGNPPDEAGPNLQGFDISIWTYSNATHLPTTKFWPSGVGVWKHYNNTVVNEWNAYYLHCNWTTANDFVLAIRQSGNSPNCDGIWRTTPPATDQYRNFTYYNQVWGNMDTSTAGDLILKVEYLSNSAVQNATVGELKALFK